MSHELFRLREKLANTAHLISPQSFDAVLDYVEKRCSGEANISEPKTAEANSRYSFNQDLGVATINLDGPMTYKPVTMFGMDCGGFSYEKFKEDFTHLAENGAKTVALMVSSGGGEAYQLFPTAEYIRKTADKYGIKLLAYVDGMAASAAYGLSSIADEIIVAPGAEVGSIGVVVRLMNDSKALEKEGYQRTFVYAGASKVPYANDGSFREDFIADIQNKVDVLYKEFTEHVSMHRNMSVEAVRSTEAKTFLPDAAIELGLADKVMSVEDFYDYLADVAQNKEGLVNNMFKNKLFSLSKEDDVDMTALAELQAELEGVKTELANAKAGMVELTSIKEQMALAQTALASKEKELADAKALVEQMAMEKEQTRKSARKEKLSAVMAAEKVEGVAASLETLSDEAFDTVLAGFKVQREIIASSELMTEIGGEGVESETATQSVKAAANTEAAIKAKLGLK